MVVMSDEPTGATPARPAPPAPTASGSARPDSTNPPTIAVLGGTGDQGLGLAYRWARAGLPVLIGSRQAERAQDAAAQIGLGVQGGTNSDVAARCDIALVAVPWAGHAALLADLAEPLAGKIVIDCVNPLGFDKQGSYSLAVAEGSAAQQAQALLPDSTVVGAFHHVSAVLLADRDSDAVPAMDILVLGDDRSATDLVQGLADRVPGLRGVYGGRLRNCGQVEALTANLISINRRYKGHAGVAITDLP